LKVSDLGDWPKKHLELINHYYDRTEHYAEFIDIIENYYSKIPELETLDKVNWKLVEKLVEIWQIDTPIIFSSELDDSIQDDKTERLVNLLKQVGATGYYAGIKSFEYLDVEKFKKSGIELVYQEFSYREHQQAYEPFIPNLSVIDLLFNTGREGKEYF
jgi:hypothetical protein